MVADEINLYKDTPAEQVFDDFEEYFFAGHPLAHGILGDVVSLNEMQSEVVGTTPAGFSARADALFLHGPIVGGAIYGLAERAISRRNFQKLKEDKAEQTPPETLLS